MHLRKLLVFVLGHKDVILWHQQPKGSGDGAVKEKSFYMLLVLSCYKFKLVWSLQDVKFNPMVTTKKIAVEYTQKEISLQKNHRRQECRKWRTKSYMVYRKQRVQRPKSLLISNYSINRLNSTIKRQRMAEWIKIYAPTRCCLQETHLRSKDTQTGLKWKDRKRYYMEIEPNESGGGYTKYTTRRYNNYKHICA